MNQWRYRVRGYYADDVKLPKVPGTLAMEVGHDSLSGAQMEEEVFRSRDDIGEVELIGPVGS